MEHISCPSCNREFELPRRYLINEDDFDFKPLPRLLSCLHTVCHSCLQDQKERSTIGQVKCPICKNKEVIKSVKTLPLDISILKEIVKTTGAGSMATCSQCYEDVPSFSFCLTCSSSLCEFHHQNHKLSVHTSKHNIHTFKDISFHGLNIDFTFPPVACPEVVMQDCSLYCQDCLHLISPQAMIENHRDHQVEDFKELVPAMEKTVRESMQQSKSNASVLSAQIAKTQEKLRQLDENEYSTAGEINEVFGTLHDLLEKREKELVDRLGRLTQEKRFQLTEQLSLLSDLNEDCVHAAQVAEELLRDTANKPIEGMYLVAATETVEFRSDTLNEQLETTLKQLQEVNPAMGVQFSQSDMTELSAYIKAFGAISSSHRPTLGTAAGAKDKSKSTNKDKKSNTELPAIRFTVKLKNEKSAEHSRPGAYKENEYVIVEAHLIDSTTGSTITTTTTASSTKKTEAKVPDDGDLGTTTDGHTLLGRVLVHTDIDRKLLNRHELRSYFESYNEEDGLPVMRICKEFVHS